MKSLVVVGFTCALLAGCSGSGPTASTVVVTSASMAAPATSRLTAKEGARVATTRPESSLRRTAAEKSRCESGDDSACLLAGSFER